MTRRFQVTALCGVQFVDVMGVTSALTAIPAMLRGVSAPTAATPVLATAYAMFFGGLLVIGARLGDRYGHRRLVLLGLGVFGLVGLVGATAQGVTGLIVARALQGAAAALSVPSALRLLLDAAPEDGGRRGALAAWSASGAAAGALGFLVGGVITWWLGWRAVFAVNLPVALSLFATIVFGVPRSRARSNADGLDVSGCLLLVAAVMALICGAAVAEQPGRTMMGALFAAGGLVLGAGFAVRQRRARSPLVPRGAFASPNLRTGTLTAFVNTAATSSTAVLATLFLQQRQGLSAVEAAVSLLPLSLGVIAGAALCRRMGRRWAACRLAAIGLVGIAASDVLLAVTYGSRIGVVLGLLVCGTGLGVASVGATSMGTDVPEELKGTASGVLNTGAQLGTAIGVAGLLLLAARAPAPVPGTAAAWGAGAMLAGAAALVLLFRVRAPAVRRVHPGSEGGSGSRSETPEGS